MPEKEPEEYHPTLLERLPLLAVILCIIGVMALGIIQNNERATIQLNAKIFCIDQGFDTGSRRWMDTNMMPTGVTADQFTNEIVCEGFKEICDQDSTCGLVAMKKTFEVPLYG